MSKLATILQPVSIYLVLKNFHENSETALLSYLQNNKSKPKLK